MEDVNKGKQAMVERIKEIINQVFEERRIKVNRIIPFVSRARWDFKSISDWDLLITVEYKLSRRSKISHLIRRILANEYILVV